MDLVCLAKIRHLKGIHWSFRMQLGCPNKDERTFKSSLLRINNENVLPVLPKI